MADHVHVYVHVAPNGTLPLVCQCACGDKLTPGQIVRARIEAGEKV